MEIRRTDTFGIMSNMIELPAKGIFYANQVCAAGQFYEDNPHKLGEKTAGDHEWQGGSHVYQ